MLHGNDVSGYQPNWRPAHGDGFGIVKVTESTGYVNPSYGAQLAAIRARKIPAGHYLFLQPGSPQAQAAWFMKHARILAGDFIAVDWETAASNAVKDATIQALRKYAPHTAVGLYTSRSMWHASNKFAGDFLWIASPGVRPDSSIPWTFWQDSWSPIDHNQCKYATVAELRKAMIKGNPPTPPPPMTGKQWLPRYGIWGCGCMALTLPHIEAEGISAQEIHDRLTFPQGAYHPGFGPSGGTHDKGGVGDSNQGGAARSKQQGRWERWGVIDFERWPPLFVHHNHLLWVGCPHQSPAAAAQVSGALHHGWNGLYGSAARWGDYSLVPKDTWQQAYRKYAHETPLVKPHPPTPAPTKGILGMTNELGPLQNAGQKLALKTGVDTFVPVDPKGNVSIMGTDSGTVIVRALLEADGLQPGETITIRFWVGAWPHDRVIRSCRQVAVTATENRRELTFIGNVPKVGKGEAPRLRILATSHAAAASIQLLELDGRYQ